MEPKVILVDEQDNEVGTMGKQLAHVEGVLHRAFSVFLFNKKGELLLQQRALSKYHSGGLWTNTCCSHPMPNEDLNVAVKRRLVEELGITADTTAIGSVLYKAEFGNGLIEHEYDHVFIGEYDGHPTINKEEVETVKYISLEDLDDWLANKPNDFTAWFPLCLDIVKQEIQSKITL
ncbi:isopentenyl-diphosphate Delta-isomerase [Flammeovirga yaeyamensis]|uniref:Isopentenyl-diphosphate delta-isomerase n=1 Tax=Flammeovirga yaeyamensis TaxID=367791 RepID=A0AAX1N8R9_9BACT|nr:isopentenyl-diphosphate Delta-isomerase [Flammeovirga yaeyamensis]MBB3698973.1 isopentenyl-diphosphate delta-isomerase [Flammeovirga yaeyamensis]NMF36407.1 isopentenyl-diphosphate Delta-isomerase [Flammeovirga yaeyamensis]QWG03632.1 isopentenyl-diphosphate Delta-isomerase [Flammeovirga yaeyamensis]